MQYDTCYFSVMQHLLSNASRNHCGHCIEVTVVERYNSTLS